MLRQSADMIEKPDTEVSHSMIGGPDTDWIRNLSQIKNSLQGLKMNKSRMSSLTYATTHGTRLLQ